MLKKYHYINLLFLLLIWAGPSCHQGSGKENKALKGIKELPHFTLLSLDSSHILKSEEIPAGRPCVFFYFDPTCEHCQKQTESIISHRQEFQNVRFYFLSVASQKEIDSFYRYYHLDEQPNIFVGIDYQFSFYNAFLPSTIPYMAVYNDKRALAKVYNGAADIHSFIDLIRY
jgi:hypothetical protein